MTLNYPDQTRANDFSVTQDQHLPKGITMKTLNRSNKLSTSPLAIITLTAIIFVLGGCAGMTSQEKGTATGAVIGGVAGNLLCGGLACTAAGAAVGGVVGHEITKKK